MTKIISILLFLGLIGGVSFWQLFSPDAGEEVQFVKVEEREIAPVMLERGVIAPIEAEIIQAKIAGKILSIRSDSDFVEKGGVVAEIDTGNYSRDLADLEVDLRAERLTLLIEKQKLARVTAEADRRMSEKAINLKAAITEKDYEFGKPHKTELRNLEIQLELKKIDLEEAQAALTRQRRLFAKEFISKASLEPYERRYKTAVEKVKDAELNITIAKKGITEERRVELKQNVMRRRAELARAENRKQRKVVEQSDIIKVSKQKIEELLYKKENLLSKIEQSVCYAESTGFIRIRSFWDYQSGGQMTKYRPGVNIYERDVIAEVIKPGEMVVELIFNESDFHRLKVDLPVEITLPAYPGKAFKGRLSRLGAIGKDRNLWMKELKGKSGIAMYNAAVSFEKAEDLLRPGMSAITRIILEESRRGLTVSRQSIEEQAGKFFVYKNGSRQEVQGRYVDELYFEVTAGLQQGDSVEVLTAKGREL